MQGPKASLLGATAGRWGRVLRSRLYRVTTMYSTALWSLDMGDDDPTGLTSGAAVPPDIIR